MSKTGRNYFAIIAEGHTPSNTAGVVDLSPKYSALKTELKSALFIAPASGVPGFLTITFDRSYAVGDLVKVTITSNLTSGQLWSKTYTHKVNLNSELEVTVNNITFPASPSGSNNGAQCG